MDDRSLVDYLQLAFCEGIGALTYQNLIGHFSDPGEVLQASSQDLYRIQGIGRKTVQAIRDSQANRHQMAEQLQICHDNQIRVIPFGTALYPTLLKHIPTPPPLLFCKGNPELLSDPWPHQNTIAIVGTRQATQYGLRTTERLTSQLTADGFTTVSGLARGIDKTVHQATLDKQGTTIAVLGSGLLRIYPSEHQGLAHEILKQGLLISEVLPTQPPHSRLFPRRNRIISGISRGVVVMEAAVRSGALITARHATEQNREVMAVPGLIDTPAAAGCNRLIKDGAQLVETTDDIYAALEHTLAHRPADFDEQISLPPLTKTEQQIYNLIPGEATYIDFLAQDSQYSMQQLLATITALELKNVIRRPSGSMVERVR